MKFHAIREAIFFSVQILYNTVLLLVKSRQRLLTGTLCHTSQQPPSLGGYNPSYKTRSLKTRGLQYVI